MKTTLDLPDDLVRELKLRSVHERRKLKDVAAQMIRRGLTMKDPLVARSPSLPSGLVLNDQGFPIFKCRLNAPAEPGDADALIALEQKILTQEDLTRAGLAP
jgi:hypothetical protein